MKPDKNSYGAIVPVMAAALLIAFVLVIWSPFAVSGMLSSRQAAGEDARGGAPTENVGTEETAAIAQTGETAESLTPQEEARAAQRAREREQGWLRVEQKQEEEHERQLQEERRAQQAAMEEAAENNTWELGEDPSAVEGAFGAVFREIFEPIGDTCESYFDAKGNPYLVLSPGSVVLDGETEPRNTIRTLVYDRVSKNGECHLIVFYEEILNEDGTEYTTAIRNTYAVKM